MRKVVVGLAVGALVAAATGACSQAGVAEGPGGAAGTGGSSGGGGQGGSTAGTGGVAGGDCCPAQTPPGSICCRDRTTKECTCEPIGCWASGEHCFCGREMRVKGIVGQDGQQVPSCAADPGEVCCVGGVGDPVCGCSVGTTDCGFESFEAPDCKETEANCPDLAEVCP